MTSLSAAELHIIQSMLVKEHGPSSRFLSQLASARVGKRRMTGGGVFVDLVVADSAHRVDKANGDVTEFYSTSLPPPADSVGFTLFIRGGYLSFLEGYTFGDVAWPKEPMEDWLVLHPVEAPHQKAK
jgi:hypothetical protein